MRRWFLIDGKLTMDDIRQSYKTVLDQELSEEEIHSMFKHCNFSGSGAIEYSEFVVASLMQKDLIDDQKLQAAFDIFDRDGKGYISCEDIQRVLKLEAEMEDYVVHKVIKQVDINGDGQVQFDEFKEMMFTNQALSHDPDEDDCHNENFGKIMSALESKQ